MDRIVNWELLSNPINWIIVVLMLAIGTFALALLMSNTPAVMHTLD
jgi:hypothetical protein